MPAVHDPRPYAGLDPRLVREQAARLPHVGPARWKGHTDCLVGPFSSRGVADHFANRVVDFGSFDAHTGRIFARGDGWFVEILPDAAGS